MTSQEISEADPRLVLWKRCSENILYILLIYQIFLAILYHKQPMKEVIFSKAARFSLATLVKKWTSSYAFFLKSSCFTEQAWEAIPK